MLFGVVVFYVVMMVLVEFGELIEDEYWVFYGFGDDECDIVMVVDSGVLNVVYGIIY